MRPLTLSSERFPAGGGIDARTVKRALGRSTYDPWSVFLRETLQNSWDARSSADGPISFSVDAWFATDEQGAVLRDTVFAELPPGLDLQQELDTEPMPVLVVTDWGTHGLGGPTRADQATSERTDFIDFVRNIGRDQKKGLGGGTYGLGKGVLFQHSVHDTILVFSRTTFLDRPVSRFMGLAVSAPYEAGRLRYTGRHWWGIADEVTGANPVQGRSAEELANALGMNLIPEGETGTAIMVIGPAALDEGDWAGRDTIDDIVDRIVDAAAWHAWPHMSGSVAKPSIRLTFSCEGHAVAPPDPSQHPVLKHYVGAYRRALEVVTGARQAGSPDLYTAVDLRSERPARRLGVLAFRQYPHDEAAVSPLFGEVDSHVALLRNPRLVVKYLHVGSGTEAVATAGVFVADSALDESFALSEPVTHDDWIPQRAQGEQYERNPVRQALDRIRRTFRARAVEPVGEGDSAHLRGLTALAAALGGLFAGLPGGVDAGISAAPGGPALTSSGGSGGGTRDGGAPRRHAMARIGEEARLMITEAGSTAVEFDVYATAPDGARARVYAFPRVVLEGTSLESPDDAPVGAPAPRVLGWRQRDTDELTPGDVLTINDESVAEWVVRVHQPNDTAVTLTLRVEEDTI